MMGTIIIFMVSYVSLLVVTPRLDSEHVQHYEYMQIPLHCSLSFHNVP